MYTNIIHRSVDDSYVCKEYGHIPNPLDKTLTEATRLRYASRWEDIAAYAKEHPENVTEEPAPSELTLEELKSIKLYEINSAYDSATSSLVSTYPYTELLTFDKQEQEARAYSADHSASTPFLSGLAKARGITLDDLVGRVIKKSEAFAFAVATLTGQRQRYEDLLDAAITAEEIAAIVPEYKLPDAGTTTEDSMSAFFYNNL